MPSEATAPTALKRAVVFLGPPGAGKGTQAKLAAKEHAFAHLSTGDMLRDNVARGTALGRLAKTYMDRGDLVPDEVVMQMVEERIAQPDCANGFVLDGFPRTLAQAEKLGEILQRKAWGKPLVVNFEVDRNALIRRLTGRRTCKTCGQIYNIYDSPPKTEGRCDLDNGELMQRPDDKESVIAERLNVYDAQTRALIDYYRKQNALVDVNGMASPTEVAASVRQVLSAAA